MTRRAAAGLGRLLPLLLIAAAVVVVGAALISACGSSGGSTGGTASGSSSPATTGPVSTSPVASGSPSGVAGSQTTLGLYFMRGDKLGVASRSVPHTTMPATESLKALLAGPSPDEKAAGLSSAIPAGTTLDRLAIAAGTATVDLSAEFASGGGSLSMTARVAQVVYTLTRFPTVRRVQFLVGGQPVDGLGGEGVVLTQPQRRADWRDLEPPIFVESPGVGAAISSPFVFAGTARVFEGTVLARLVDSSGRRIVEVVVTADTGAPGRGRFSKAVPFTTAAKAGTLIVFDQSMKDGSRQDEVKIPVTFSAD